MNLDVIAIQADLAPRGTWLLESRRQSMNLPAGTGRGPVSLASKPKFPDQLIPVFSTDLQRVFSREFTSLRTSSPLTWRLPERPLSYHILRYWRIPGATSAFGLSSPPVPRACRREHDPVCRPRRVTSNVTDLLQATPPVCWRPLRSRAGKDNTERLSGQACFPTIFEMCGVPLPERVSGLIPARADSPAGESRTPRRRSQRRC
ncbi:MAG: hypothetical protein FD129_1663 [bacterium]|nr:MAG: hypothetical protein FD129_1663 [bacterium]